MLVMAVKKEYCFGIKFFFFPTCAPGSLSISIVWWFLNVKVLWEVRRRLRTEIDAWLQIWEELRGFRFQSLSEKTIWSDNSPVLLRQNLFTANTYTYSCLFKYKVVDCLFDLTTYTIKSRKHESMLDADIKDTEF